MLDNIDGVLDMASGRPIPAILDSFIHVRATERAFQIISEAAKELPAGYREAEPRVPWRSIIGIGNLLRHEYYRIDPAVLADILTNELPMLRSADLRLMERVAE